MEDLRKIIYEKCYLEREKISLISKIYDPLFQTTSKLKVREGYGSIPPNVNIPLDMIIATTNYDMSLELYFMSNEIYYSDGYTGPSGSLIKKFAPNMLQNAYNYRHFIIKLHGSIWQFIRNNEMIKTIIDPEKAPIPISIEKEMMIYPTKEKEILTYQYYPFFNLFKNIKWDSLVVIGYSFRDDPINMAIIENMQLIPTSKIIVINPDPEKVLDNLEWKIPGERVIKIPGKFGSDEINKELLEM